MKIIDCEQGTEEWHAARAGLPTASEFSKLVTSKGAPSKQWEDYALTLAGDAYAGKPLDAWEGNGATERGKTLEPDAVAYYEAMNDCDTQALGFVTDDTGSWGCSPDRLVADDGLLEIKCQQAKGHIKTLLYIDKNGTIPTDYVQQTQGQMLITGRKWCDLLFFHPDLPPRIFRVVPVGEVIDGLLEARGNVLNRRDEILKFLRIAEGV